MHAGKDSVAFTAAMLISTFSYNARRNTVIFKDFILEDDDGSSGYSPSEAGEIWASRSFSDIESDWEGDFGGF